MKEKLAIYPFDEELLPIIRHCEKISLYKLEKVIIPVGWNDLSEIEPSCKDMSCYENTFYSDNYILEIDAILLCKSKFAKDISIYHSLISLAQKHEKKILYMPNMKAELGDLVQPSWICIDNEEADIVRSNNLQQIDRPVIMVVGLGEYCEKMEIQISLYEYFKKNGYNPSLICSNQIGKLLGFHTLPSFLNKNEVNFSDKVESFNTYVKSIEMKENPDLFIIGIPGAPMKYDQKIVNGYGYFHYIIGNAIVPDISILSLYCGKYDEASIKELKSTFYYRFGIKVNYFHISKKVCTPSFENQRLEYYSVDYDYMIENLVRPQLELPVFNVNDADSSGVLFDKVRKELQNNTPRI